MLVSKLSFIGDCIYYKKGNFDFPSLNILSLWLISLLEQYFEDVKDLFSQ